MQQPPRQRRTRLILLAVAPVLVGAGASIGWAAGGAAPAEPTVVVREPLAMATQPRGVEGRNLGLSRVTVMPGAELAAHHHPGTQVAYVERGTLTYTVNVGKVRVSKGSADDPTTVRTISAGETAKVRAGQWLVEQPGDQHQAANRGSVPVVIFTATLLKKGEPAAIPD